MANTDKNIIITPNNGQAADPKISFVGASAVLGPKEITLKVYSDNGGTLSFDGSAGQLFSITNSLVGTLFSVNDVSGIPSLEIFDTGLVRLGEYAGNIVLGNGVDNGLDKLQVAGDVRLYTAATLGTMFFGSDNNASRYLRGNSAELQVGVTLNDLRFMTTGSAQIESDAVSGTTALALNARISHVAGNLLEVKNAGVVKLSVAFDGALNTVGAITQNGSQVWHAGNFTPANYATLASPTFTGTPIFPANVVTLANMADLTTGSLIGRSTAATGVPEVITVGSGLSLVGGVLTATGGGGSVTSVSVITANGISGSVATATSTPAITLTLGAITPTSVVASGNVTGSNLSGTNTGDQNLAPYALLAGATFSGPTTFNKQVLNTNNQNIDGANFAVDTINKTITEYAYVVKRSGVVVGGILIDGSGALAAGTTISGNLAWHSGNLTTADILTKIKTVDGATSGLDADLLDGQEGAYYNLFTNLTSKPTTLTGYGITDGIKLDDVIMNNNSFGGRRLYNATLDNALAAADKRYYVTITTHLQTYLAESYPKLNPAWVSSYTVTGSGTTRSVTSSPAAIVVYNGTTICMVSGSPTTEFQYSYSAGTLTFGATVPGVVTVYPDDTVPQYLDSPVQNTLSSVLVFDGNYESMASAPVGQYLKIRIVASADGLTGWPGYPYGEYFLSYYYTDTPASAEYRNYNRNYYGHGIGWKTVPFTDYVGTNAAANYIQKVSDFTNYGRTIVEFIVQSHASHAASVTEVEWKLQRPAMTELSAVTKYGANKLYQNLTFGTQTATNVTITPAGGITASGIINAGSITAAGATINGDITISRPATPTTGVVYLGNQSGGSRYLYYDGTNYHMVGTSLYVNGTPVASLSGPTFTGVPSAPTAAVNTNTTQLATTAFVSTSMDLRFRSVTTGGVLDWNDNTNCVPGIGPTLLAGSATNGPGGGTYYHTFTVQYSAAASNCTQFAIPYNGYTMYFRYRYSGAWTGWTRLATDTDLTSKANLTGATFTGAITATNLSGTNTGDQVNITGNAATVTTNANLTGNVTSVGNVTTIAAGVVTAAMQTPAAANSLSGNNTGSTAAPADLTSAQVKTMLNLTGTNSGDQTITLTGHITGTGTGSFATTIAAGVITNAMQSPQTAMTLSGNNTAGAIAPADLTVAQVNVMLPAFTTALKGLVPAPGSSPGTTFLRDDGVWVAPVGSGVSLSAANTWTAQNTFAAGTITTSQPLTLTQTWNAAAVPFTGLLANYTDTASTTASLLIDLQVGGASKFSVRKDGYISGYTLAVAIIDMAGWWQMSQSAVGGVSFGNGHRLAWANTSTFGAGSIDTALMRNAAGVVEINNGTAGTFTDLKLRTLLAGGGATITANAPVIDASQTWNNVAVTFTGLKLNATITAASNSSLLCDFQVGGVTKFNVDRYGMVTADSLYLGTWVQAGANTISQRSAGRFVLSSTANAAGSADIGWLREAAGLGAVTDGSATLTNYRDWKVRTLFAGAGMTQTANTPVIDASQTWNNAAIPFTAIKSNITDTASSAASLLIDLQVGGVSKFNVDKLGILITMSGGVIRDWGSGQIGTGPSGQNVYLAAQGVCISGTQHFGWGPSFGNIDTMLSRRGAGNLQFGTNDAAVPVAQIVSFQGARSGTDTNTAAVTATIQGSLGTGTGAVGDLVIKTGTIAIAGATQHLATTRLTINSTAATFTVPIVGSLNGNAATVTTNANLTGNVTSVGNATTIAAGVVTLANMANMATASFIGRNTAAVGVPEVLAAATVKTMLNLTGTNSGDQTITLTGHVTGTGTGSFATTIAAGVITNAMQSPQTAMTISGNNTGVAAAPMDLTAAQVRTLLNVADGATANTGTVTGVTATGPVVSSGGTAPVISMAAATTTVPGYLTAADWTTFNGKQAALGFTPYNSTNPSGYTSNTGTVTAVSIATANGVSGTSSGGATPALTITLGAITPTSVVTSGPATINGLLSVQVGTLSTQTIIAGKGWSNSIPRWKEVLEADASFSIFGYDTGGITPTQILNLRTTVAGGSQALTVYGTVVAASNFTSSTTNAIFATTGAGAVYLRPNGSGSTTGQLYIDNAGNVSGNTFTATSSILQSGTATLILATTGAGQLYLRPNGNGSTSGQVTVDGSGNVAVIGQLDINGQALRVRGWAATQADGVVYFGDAATDHYIYKTGGAFTFKHTAGTSSLNAAGTIWTSGNLTFGGGLSLVGGVLSSSSGFGWTTITNANVTAASNTGYIMETGGTLRTVTLPASVAAGFSISVNASAGQVKVVSNGNTIDGVGAGNDLLLSDGNTVSLVAKATGVLEIVYGGNGTANVIPQNSQSAAYTTVLADGGSHIFHPSADTTARIWSIPANASVPYPIGTALTFVNQNAAGVITIAIITDTMRLAGAGTTGNRTLAANGIATALKVTTTEWLISGTGLT